ncbi:unnamed protein product [Rotaria sp. Silwood2]|nr:unnamed protein product [Rotaria sp. Silwood2]CAF2641190.1 unnamed protein product [Rotaria sp. Silwood2]CAF3919392.1 unnamed protein product [Rotaria sp. Silwood2]CAF4014816.1 unnamed protein product [Rotaria sp. Silwood2]
MELFDDVVEDGGIEPHPLSDDDLPSDDDNDDDDDDDEFDKTDIGHDSISIKKPLAGMLPNTYEGKTAEELFPAFKPNAILQFNKIFGIGKSNHLPKLWVNLRKRSVNGNVDHQIREATITECAVDHETQFLGRLPPVINEPISDGQDSSLNDMKIANWRVGPARLWYDQIGLSLDLPSYDYGFKTKQPQILQTQISKEQPTNDNELTGHASLPVNLTRWEDDIIYDTSILRDKLDLNTPKIRYCGWVPTTNYRTLANFQKNVFGKNVDYLENTSNDDAKYKSWYSIFPIDNYDLMYGDWEKDIIIDPENMERIREPPELVLDENDDHLIFEIPTDPNDCQTRQQRIRDPRDKPDGNTLINPAKAGKVPHKDTRGRVTRRVLTGSGILKEAMDNDDDANDQTDSPKNDFWNLSNDEYYNPRLVDSVGKNLGTLNLQHATPAVELCTQLFPTHLNATKLRHFHRPTIKKFLHGKLKPGEYHPVQTVQKISDTRAAEREKERQAYGGGEMFYMRRLQDLSALDSDLVLAEYCEQYPPLLNQIGMATRIKNYFKKKPGKQDNPPMLDYGEISYAHTSPFQADMLPGEILQAFENHMFRAPIFRHDLLPTDFVVLRTKQNYHIRNIRNIFTVGQECPLQEVPGPNSKRANIFARDFLQAYIFRLFWKSRDKPPRIKMEDVRKAFPQNAENSIRKRLKMSSDFKRTGGVHCNWWVLRSDFRLPSQEEIRQLVTPEQCCAYYSMQAAEQRLKDAGYGEKVLFAAVDEEAADENDTSKIEDEVKCAPWHTTKAYLDSLKGKCWLQLRGFADPTGSGEGFSYVRVSNKPNAREAEPEAIQTKKMVTGTDADLRRLHLKDAKKILNKFGVSDSYVRNLSRWQIIDIVRTMSTARARDGEDGAAMAKFARGNRYSQMEYQEKYKEDCRKIFEIQNKSLASNHLTSTDNETSGDEDSDVDEMRKNLESMLEPTVSKQSNETKPNVDALDTAKKTGSRVLKIVRTYLDDNGREYQRVEYVRKPMVVEAYSKIRTTKDNDFIRQFFTLDEDQRENLRRERRRLQEQLRRVRRQDRLQQRNTTMPTNTSIDHHSPSSRSTNPSPVRNSHMQLNNNDLSSIKLPNDSDLLIKNEPILMDENHSDLFMDNNHNITSTSQLISTSIDNLNSNSQSGFGNYFNSISFTDEGQENNEMNTSMTLQTNGTDSTTTTTTIKRRKKSEKDLKSLKCGACGAQGHMRTNRVCPMHGKTASSGNMQTNITVDSEDAQHSFDLQQHDTTNTSMNVGDVSVKMVEGGGTKLIFAKNVLEKVSSKDSIRKPKKSRTSKLSASGIEPTGDGDESTTNSQSTPINPNINIERPPTPPPIVHVSKIPFIPPVKSSSSSSPSVNLTYTPKSSGTLKTTLSHTGNRRKSSTTPTNGENQLKHSKSCISATPSTGFRQQPTSTPLSTGPLGTMFSFPPNTPTTPTPSSTGVDYLDKRARTVQRRRIDPVVSFATLLESILNELRDMPEATMFLTPVNSRTYPDYYELIKNPMDLQKIRQRVLAHTYETREGFLNDIRQLVENSRQFNGEYDQITRDAQTIFAACFQKFAANEDKLMKLEKAINPLLDDDLLVAMSYLFERILSEHLMNVENSWPFHHAVSKVRFKDYYDIVKTPMDLEKIKNNILKHTYRSRASMLADVNLLYTNSVQYNGESHSITAIASKIVQTCKEQFEEHAEQFDALERNLQQQALGFIKPTEQISNDDDWQQMITTSTTNNFPFNQLVEEPDDNNDLKSPTTLGMSLETFIARDFSAMEHNVQTMKTEQKEDDDDDDQYQTIERITTEDILGNISESDTSDDDDDDDDTKKSSSMFTSKTQQDISNDPNLMANESLTSSSKHRHHKHSKKRLKTFHSHTTSTDAAALQLSEDEL